MSILPISGSLGGNDVTQGQFKTSIEAQRQFIEDSIGTDSTDLQVVDKISNETIGGVKTFSSSPITPTPTLGDNSTKVATTAFVLANSTSLEAGVGMEASGGNLNFNPISLPTVTTELITSDYVVVSDSTSPRKITLDNFANKIGAGGLGSGQTYQNPTRTLGATYTNSTNKPIEVTVGISTGTTATVTVGANVSSYVRASGTIILQFIVPNGVSYSVTMTAFSSGLSWKELR